MKAFNSVSSRLRGIADRWSEPTDVPGPPESARGAFPANTDTEQPSTQRPVTTRPIVPHHSPGQAEWFFTDSTSRFLASKLHGLSLHLGTPTTAVVAGRNATLVDTSPWVTSRFGPIPGTHFQTDVEHFQADCRFDSAILDPPWYGRNLLTWLEMASHMVRTGGALVMPLLGGGTRPSAQKDRKEILALAARIGRFSVERDQIEYDVPTFEARALEIAGVPPLKAWRRADLLLVTNDFPAGRPWVQPPTAEWYDVRIGDHIVSIRSTVSRAPKQDLASNGAAYTPLGTVAQVSRRDPVLQRAHVWTCENRVLQVSDAASFLDLFDRLARQPESKNSSVAELRHHLFGGK